MIQNFACYSKFQIDQMHPRCRAEGLEALNGDNPIGIGGLEKERIHEAVISLETPGGLIMNG